MVSSLRALLAEIIDYAGLFPPARLPLDQAIRAYARYRRGPQNWMLGRFVCPAERLGELEPLVPELFSLEFPLRIAALGRGGKSTAEFLTGLRADLEAIGAFRERHHERTEVAVYEVRLPREILVADSGEAAGNLLKDVAQALEQTSLPSLTAYYEPAPGEAWRPSLAVLKEALAKDNRQRTGSNRGPIRSAGLKLRCGGLEAVDVPSPEQVAFAITVCRDSGVPLKFTAGLHHPIRHFDPGVQMIMHGFLNVFVAGVLAHARHLGEDQVRQIIEDQDAEALTFDAEGLRWKDYRATVAGIGAARRFVVSFGSCSFEEPCDDLRTMGLLP
jgi:hypothetical protein